MSQQATQTGPYPPPGAPGQRPPHGVPGHFPPPIAPGQSPVPVQYQPPGVLGQHQVPVQYPIPDVSGHPPVPEQYPPPGFPGQYTPRAVPGSYPSPGAPVNYPPHCFPEYLPSSSASPGQYPPHGATVMYPPPSIPSTGGPVHYPLPGAPGQNTAGFPAANHGTPGWDAEDSDNEDYLRSKHSRHPVHVKFVNKTNKKHKLLWINEKGKMKKMKKIEKIKEGRTESVDTFETHPFTIYTKKGPEVVINGNFTFIPEAAPGGHGEIKAEITDAPNDRHSLRSSQTGHPVRLKFSNRTTRWVVLKFVDHAGKEHNIKEIAPKKAFIMDTCEGFYFIACEKGNEGNLLEFNYGWFYLVKMPHNERVRKVIITEAFDDGSSSSSE